MHNFSFHFLIAFILHCPVIVDYGAQLMNISASQFNATHIVLRIVNGCFSGKRHKLSKFLASPHIFGS